MINQLVPLMQNKMHHLKQYLSTWPRRFVFLILMAHALPLLFGADFYPFHAYNMYTFIHKNRTAYFYYPYLVDKNNNRLFTWCDNFNLSPVRFVDFYNQVRNWKLADQIPQQGYALSQVMLPRMQQKYPDRNIKCFGLVEVAWNIDTPKESRWLEAKRNYLTEYCDEK